MKMLPGSSLVQPCGLWAVALAGLVLVIGCGSPDKKGATPKRLPSTLTPQARVLVKDIFSRDPKVTQKALSTLTNASPEGLETIGVLVQMVGTPKSYSRRAEEVLTRLGAPAVQPVVRDLQTIPETSDADAIILARHRGGWDCPGESSPELAYTKAMRAVHLIRILRGIGQDAVEPLQAALAQAQAQHRDLLANWLDWAFYGDGAPAVPGWPSRN